MIFLYLMVITLSLNNFQSWLRVNEIFIFKTGISYFEFPWHVLSAPCFYSFLIHYLEIENKIVRIFQLAIITFFTLIFIQVGYIIYLKLNVDLDTLCHSITYYRSREEMFSFITSISTYIYGFYILYRKENLFPKILSFDNLKWIFTFFKVTAFMYLCWIGALILNFKTAGDINVMYYYPLRILTTVVIYILGYQGIRQLRILKERKSLRADIKKTKETKTIKTEKFTTETLTNLDEKKLKAIKKFELINNHIIKNQKFLIPKYTLQNLSNELQISTSSLSAVINNHAKKTFIDYINEMRVEQAKKILVDSKYSNYTIVAIGLESGFNSKSTFYSAFKKHMGCTPLSYKEANIPIELS